jgi:phosphate transport system substrate-binding protein
MRGRVAAAGAAVAWLLLSLALGATTAVAQGFTGAGSSFAHPILSRWAQAYAARDGEGGAVVDGEGGLDYEPVGSLGGVMRVAQRAVDFGATDVPLAPAELEAMALRQFPFVSGGVAVVVNLPGVATGTLRLSGEVLARIYLAEITRWSDPAIKALNASLPLPEAAIAVVRRSDGSGTTWHFASYLARASAAWRDRVGVGTELVWPTGEGAKGNRELAERVRALPHAIGYVEASQAARLGLPVALLENRAGAFVAPDRAALTAAMATASWDARQGFHRAVEPSADPAAYPITATVYALMPRRPDAPRRARRVLAFFRFGLTEGQAEATALGYVPLPEPAVRAVLQDWRADGRGGP